MKLHILQHAEHEGPGEIARWAEKRGHTMSGTDLHRGDTLPRVSDFDALVIMGGEMNIYQYREWPWLREESAFIRQALDAGKRAVGICLGAQFLADALGARVVQNREVELGWGPISWTAEARAFCRELPENSDVLHWHGDTYGLPEGATRLAANQACAEQGFLIPGRCLALQFHLEVDPELVKRYVDSQGDWPSGKYVRTPEEILADAEKHCAANRPLLHAMLDGFFH